MDFRVVRQIPTPSPRLRKQGQHGWLFAHEPVTTRTLVAAAVILGGVAIITVARDVHTLKGMSKFFHLDVIAGILHEMENEMKVREKVTVEEMLALCREVMADLFEEAKGYGRENRQFDPLFTVDI